jgi:hypothetical protein
MRPVREETQLERALFAARVHVRQGTLLSDDAVRDICAVLVLAGPAYELGQESEREACAAFVENADDGVPLQCLADAIRERGT